VQAALASRDQIAQLDARVRTLVELREAGAFGTALGEFDTLLVPPQILLAEVGYSATVGA
jgi:hypothetical protein